MVKARAAARVAASLVLLVCSAKLCAGQFFGVDDYFKLRRVGELAVSSDGRWLAYEVDGYSADGMHRTRRVFVRRLDVSQSDESAPDALQDASALAWIPSTHELAFLSERSGVTQVLSYDPATGRMQQRTASAEQVESFRYAPDGVSLAYVTRPTSAPGASLYDQFRGGMRGISIDPRSTSSHDFLNPHWHGMVKRPTPGLWIAAERGQPFRVELPGEPGDDTAYFWSADSRRLSVTYIASQVAAAQMRDEHTSVGVFDIGARRFAPLAQAVAAIDARPGISFAGGEWLPDSERLLLRRVIESDPWVSDSFPEWAIARAGTALPLESSWHSIEAPRAHTRFFVAGRSSILAENTVRGVRSLFHVNGGRMQSHERVARLDGSSSLFAFSAGFSRVVFVNESLTRAPEIYLQVGKQAPRQLTQLNDAITATIRFRAREVTWQGIDGVQIAGWLIEPAGPRPASGWPLVTHIHGGPAFPFPNAFAAYFAYWPYPLEAYASRGIAVFIPNYRGTHTYGRRVATATTGESVSDVIAGVQSLVDAGIADRDRLGISGHSHGAIVGPLAMARAKFFEAASFAEGVANAVVMYELMSDDANREIHDPLIGASLYRDPQRYLAESPDLQFEHLATASLFEGGSQATALLMLGFAKAALRAGMPTQFIIYPQTGHNITIPTLQREAAQRNLDWFTSWLLDT